MDELLIKGKKYISSKRASELTGYVKDYVGQLVRMGKLPAERVGRAWYVEESGILEHSKSAEQTEKEIFNGNEKVLNRAFLPTVAHRELSLLPILSSVSYYPDHGDLIPSPSKKNQPKYDSDANITATVKEIHKLQEKKVVENMMGRSVFLEVAKELPIHRAIASQKLEVLSPANNGKRAPTRQKRSTRGMKVALVAVSLALLSTVFAFETFFTPLNITIGAQVNLASSFSSSAYLGDFIRDSVEYSYSLFFF